MTTRRDLAQKDAETIFATHTSVKGLAAAIGVSRCTVWKWDKQGELTIDHVGAFLYERNLRDEAKALGISADLIWMRMERQGMALEEACTTPKQRAGFNAERRARQQEAQRRVQARARGELV